jgi:hypothetical protein
MSIKISLWGFYSPQIALEPVTAYLSNKLRRVNYIKHDVNFMLTGELLNFVDGFNTQDKSCLTLIGQHATTKPHYSPNQL